MYRRVAQAWLEKQARVSEKQRALNRKVFNAMTKDEWHTISHISKGARLSERDTIKALNSLKQGGIVWEDHRLYMRVR